MQKDILSLSEKFLAGEGQNITPAKFSQNPELNQRITKHVQDTMKQVAQTLHLYGYARIDAFVRGPADYDTPEVVIIEINTLPGLTPATCLFHQAAHHGYTPLAFLSKILDYAQEKAHA